MIRGLRHILHLLRIVWVLARHDALFVFAGYLPAPLLLPLRIGMRKLPRNPGERLALAFEKLGPSFIKLGQALSTRADLVGEEVASGLAGLRDRLPPFPTAKARAMVEEELGKPLFSLFDAFSEEPIAAASIAQVHRARTVTGRDVAVKVLRPGIRKAFENDLELFAWIAELMEHRLPAYRRLKPREVVQTLKDSIAFELDLRFEAAAAAELADNLKNDSGFRVPGVHWGLTGRSVGTLDWIEGTPIADVEALTAAGHDLNAIIAKVATSFFNQVFRDGFFHADLHPGNLFVDAKGDIIAVDFGITGRIAPRERLYLAEIFKGFLDEDYERVAKAHFAAGYVPEHKSVGQFALACRAIARPILDRPLNEISAGRLLGQLFSVTQTFEMETQPQLLLLQKNMVLVEAIGRMLNPTVNLWELARPPIEAWAIENLSPLGRLKAGGLEACATLEELPAMLRRFRAMLELHSNPEGLRLHPETVDRLGQWRRGESMPLPYVVLLVALTLALAWMGFR